MSSIRPERIQNPLFFVHRVMANLSGELEEIMGMLVNSKFQPERSDTYGRLLQFEEQLGDQPQAVQQLCRHLSTLLNHILSDIFCDDEEIAAQSLKSLGFIVYHPTLVAALSDENVYAILQHLVEVVTTTKLKAVCNLGMWCISIQQFEACFVASRIHSIIRATVYALDNPMGSISTTVEAFQAVVKLVGQTSDKMRDLSHIWAPPIYRRLLSTDKRERDMAERCLQKIKSIILPPLPLLSKTVAADIKQNLLLHMEMMLQSDGAKVHAIQAWGWVIRLLGDYVMKSRALVNQMLKIPERTFADPDPQVRVASQVAWEALIDTLIPSPTQATVDQTPPGNTLSEGAFIPASALGENQQSKVHPSLKNMKLLMMPLIGVMASRCDVSVQFSCWRTWNYILHKLDISVNHPAIVSIVLDPVVKVVFETGPDNKNLWIWDLCMNLLEEFVSIKGKNNQDELSIHVDIGALSPKTPFRWTSSEANGNFLTGLPVKWLPWNLNRLEYLLNVVGIMWKCGFEDRTLSEYSMLTLNGALRIFRLILRGVQSEVKEEFKPLDAHVEAVHIILKFVQGLCEDIAVRCSGHAEDSYLVIFQVLEIVKDELRSSTLTSSFYKVRLDLKEGWRIKGSKLSYDLASCTNRQIPGVGEITTDMVTPIVYLIFIWLSLVAFLYSDAYEEEKLSERLEKLTNIVSSGVNPLENFQALASILYGVGLNTVHLNDKIQTDQVGGRKALESLCVKSGSFFLLKAWKIFAKHLREHIEFANDVALSEIGTVDSGYQVIYSFLLFPLHGEVLCSFVNSKDNSSNHRDYGESNILSLEKEHDVITREWIMLYDSGNLVSSLKCARNNFFTEGFCKRALRVIDEEHPCMQTPEISGSKQLSYVRMSDYFLKLFGGVAAHVLKQACVTTLGMQKTNRKRKLESSVGPLRLNYSPAGNEADDDSNIKSTLTFVDRFLKLAWEAHSKNVDCNFIIVSRIFDAIACFLNRLCTKDDMLLFIQMLSDSLAKWLFACSNFERISEQSSPVFALERAWNQLLRCLQKSQPPITFDSSILSLQAPLLVAAFEHVHFPIANCTILFWEATYGNTTTLQYPESLVPVLNCLSQKVEITLPGLNILMNGHVPLASCSALCPNGTFPDQENHLWTDGSRKLNTRGANHVLENSSTPDNHSVQNKASLTRAHNFNADVDLQNIKSYNGIQQSYPVDIDRDLSHSSQGLMSSQTRANSDIMEKTSILKGKKKLKFMEESLDINYVSIPLTVKSKLCPLTDHQREVKRAQRGNGMDTMGHGPGIKTYTAVDFSHSQGNVDSEEPEDHHLSDIILDKCKRMS